MLNVVHHNVDLVHVASDNYFLQRIKLYTHRNARLWKMYTLKKIIIIFFLKSSHPHCDNVGVLRFHDGIDFSQRRDREALLLLLHFQPF